MSTIQLPAPGRLARSPGVKFFALGFIALLILIPLFFVEALQRERSARLAEVGRDIAQSWAGEQTIAGPFLFLPYLVESASGGAPQRRIAIVFPEELSVEAKADTETLRRSIYDVAVFRSAVQLGLRFAQPVITEIDSQATQVLWSEAALIVHIADVRGIKNRVVLRSDDGAAIDFKAGTIGQLANNAGINAPIRPADLGKKLTIDINLNGSRSLTFVPLGANNELAMNSTWRHPSFAGAFLPDERTIDDGFRAAWRIGHLSRTLPQAFVRDSRSLESMFAANAVTVRFYQPVDIYQMVSRALKYGVLFVGAVFLVVFALEVLAKEQLHVAQYTMVGMALVIFYVLLLSYAEHIGFNPAYLLSAGATTGLIAIYVGMSLRSAAKGAVLAVTLAGAYGLVYLLLRSEDYALLAGATAGFIGLAVLMLLTRRVDWSGLGEMARDAMSPAGAPQPSPFLAPASVPDARPPG